MKRITFVIQHLMKNHEKPTIQAAGPAGWLLDPVIQLEGHFSPRQSPLDLGLRRNVLLLRSAMRYLHPEAPTPWGAWGAMSSFAMAQFPRYEDFSARKRWETMQND